MGFRGLKTKSNMILKLLRHNRVRTQIYHTTSYSSFLAFYCDEGLFVFKQYDLV